MSQRACAAIHPQKTSVCNQLTSHARYVRLLDHPVLELRLPITASSTNRLYDFTDAFVIRVPNSHVAGWQDPRINWYALNLIDLMHCFDSVVEHGVRLGRGSFGYH